MTFVRVKRMELEVVRKIEIFAILGVGNTDTVRRKVLRDVFLMTSLIYVLR